TTPEPGSTTATSTITSRRGCRRSTGFPRLARLRRQSTRHGDCTSRRGQEQRSPSDRFGGRAVADEAGGEQAGREAEEEDRRQPVREAEGGRRQDIQAEEEQLHRRAEALHRPVGVEGEEHGRGAAD